MAPHFFMETAPSLGPPPFYGGTSGFVPAALRLRVLDEPVAVSLLGEVVCVQETSDLAQGTVTERKISDGAGQTPHRTSRSSTASPSQRPRSSPQGRTPGASATTQSGANVRDMEAAREILPRTSLFQARCERGSKAPDKPLPLWLLKTDAPRIVDTAHGIHCDCHLPSGKNSAELELFKIFIPPRELPGPQRLMKQDDLIYNPYSKFPQ
ncbi:PREDICTED: uncharacterized protein LOC108538236 [Rhinopithecus bieti]|uniref:uncharacterized protein LOC108538236 n=1 Tax=Rhinopithecus bieti TaxID=61621 RepID=UPI00083BCDAA|nr:PREDICTED: uncharacterized protein LOC108538236 [Rhinopithecus bieti]